MATTPQERRALTLAAMNGSCGPKPGWLRWANRPAGASKPTCAGWTDVRDTQGPQDDIAFTPERGWWFWDAYHGRSCAITVRQALSILRGGERPYLVAEGGYAGD